MNTTDETDQILQLRDVRKTYKEFVLDGINLTVPRGHILGLVGPNGAGKTTTIKTLMNLIRMDSGDLSIFGLGYDTHEKEIKNRIGYVGEQQYFYDNKSVDWTERFVSQYYSRWDDTEFDALLTSFDISRTKKVRELSRGMRVKLALAIALSHNAELIILDEPTAGLDPIVRREVLELLMRVTDDESRSVVISSHITDDITRISDYIAFMINGKIRMHSEKDELLSNWKLIHYKSGTLDAEMISSFSHIQDHQFGSSGVTRNYLEIRDQLTTGMATEDVKVENISLDDILISLVEDK
ncbi:MAG: ABC transporter ATP-binding protein [Candidatus Latescibacteria bacterium]|nr:ABC transporter ATP-binding protein [Candidatus Latescibacterota bacterium]